MADAAKASVEAIPDYKVRTPLQSSIMILKRHRDIMFVKDELNTCPISIIITTLAAHSYRGEEEIADALLSILTGMEAHIARDARGRAIIANPSDPLENFADKWSEFPEREQAFYTWLRQAQRDFAHAASLADRKAITDSLSPHVGTDLAKRAADRSAGTPSGLLRAATGAAAGSLSSPSFGNTARTPTKPQGFA